MKKKLLVALTTVAVFALAGCQGTEQTNDALPTSTNTPLSVTEPTLEPTSTPMPTITEVPTVVPTEKVEEPTVAPTEVPTSTPVPTEVPTSTPTPTAKPTEAPTVAPTEVPTQVPTVEPTEVPAETSMDLESIAALCKIGTEDGNFSNSLTIYEGDLDFPTLKVYGPDDIDLSQYNIRWGLSDTGIVSAIIDGEIKPAGIGTVVVTARLIDPDTGEKVKIGSVTITVELAETIQIPTGDLYEASDTGAEDDIPVLERSDVRLSTDDAGNHTITAFKNYDLKEFRIPATFDGGNVTTIGMAFCMTEIRKVVISEGIQRIEECAFYDCYELKSVTLPNTLVHIGERAFDSCSALKEVVVPASVTSIEKGAFEKGTVIIAEPGSYAEQWAKDNGYTVK